MSVRFYLGIHQPAWLARLDVPLFISDRRLRDRARLPRALGQWALDSGGFQELDLHGRWQLTTRQYVADVRRYTHEVGGLEWAAPMDWMCEPAMLARTGLTIAEHQARTVANYLELRAAAPELPFIPVLQGWTLDDYLACVDRYTAAGVDLAAAPLVGLGSICRRQATSQLTSIATTLASLGLRLHGFGVKTDGLRQAAGAFASADSLAWSATARRQQLRLPGCTSHRNCANCPRYALAWRTRVCAAASQPTAMQLSLPGVLAGRWARDGR
jgi:hypothetical protein